jgi:hypothetical protein
MDDFKGGNLVETFMCRAPRAVQLGDDMAESCCFRVNYPLTSRMRPQASKASITWTGFAEATPVPAPMFAIIDHHPPHFLNPSVIQARDGEVDHP